MSNKSRVRAMNTHPDFSFSEDGSIATIFGVTYATDLFRHLGIAPIGSRMEIVAREDGVVTLRQLSAEQDSAQPAMRELNPCTKAEFNAFLEAYPRPLTRDICRIPDPALVSYNDLTLGKWPESMVASHLFDDRDCTHSSWRILAGGIPTTPTTEPAFARIANVDIDDNEVHTTESRLTIFHSGEGANFSVEGARALRDFLNTVLPELP